MSTLLQNCKKIGWGAEAKISANIAGFKGGVGAGYNQQDANDDSNKISATQDAKDSSYSCIGSSSCNSCGEGQVSDQHAVPVLLDLRPITELLAPPFFDTYEMTVNVRRRLINDLMNYLAGEELPRKVDVFHYLSLSFLRPLGFYQDSPDDPHPGRLREMPGGLHRCDNPISVKVAGSSGSGKETLLEFPKFSFAHKAPPPIKQAFCYSGSHTDNQVVVEITLPTYVIWTYDSCGPLGEYSQDVVESVMKVEFALDDERLLSTEGVTGTFVLPIVEPTNDLTFEGDEPDGLPDEAGFSTFVLKFPVVLKKLNLQDAFFNGLPAGWKDAEWKT